MVSTEHLLPLDVAVVHGRMPAIIELARGKKVLHIGCTDCGLTQERMAKRDHLHLKLLDVASRVWGVDIDREGLDTMRNLGITDLYEGDAERLEELSLDDKPDLIVASELMEHLDNPGRFLESARRFGCAMVVSVPNAYSSRAFDQLAGGAEMVHEDHNYYYSYTTLKTLARKHGWRTDRCICYYWHGTKEESAILMQRLKASPFYCDGLIFLLSPDNADGLQTLPDHPVNSEVHVVRPELTANHVRQTISNRRLLFIANADDFRFVDPIIANLERAGNDIRKVKVADAKGDQLLKHLEWCDLAWFEWATGPALIAASNLPKTKPVVVRLHRYEAFTESPKKIDWKNIDDLIFIAPHVEAILEDLHGLRLSDLTRTHIIPNGVDLDRFRLLERERGFNIAFVARVQSDKNPALMLQIMESLVKREPRFRLYWAGTVQDRALDIYLHKMVEQLGLAGHVFLDGNIEDISAWLEDKHYLLLTSVVEGHPVCVIEAMARGLKPVLHDYVGEPAGQFGPEFVFRTVDEAVELLLDTRFEPEHYRRIIEERYSRGRELNAVDQILDQLLETSNIVSDTSKEDVDVPPLPEPIITVAIITYNRADLLPEAIESALKQKDARDYEVLVVDDGSTDDTDAVMAACRDPRIRYLKCEHRGAPATLNSAIEAARGKYILWLDSDDAILPKTVALYQSAIAEHPDVDVFYGDWIITDEKMRATGKKEFSDWYRMKNKLFGMLVNNTVLPHGGAVVRRTCFDLAGGFDEFFQNCYDDEFWSRLARQAEFKHIKATVYRRRMHGTMMMSDRDKVHQKYSPPIIKAVLKRYTLRELFPGEPWDVRSEAECESRALLIVAAHLFELKDYEGSLEFVRQAQQLHPSARNSRAVKQLQGLIRKQKVPLKQPGRKPGIDSGPAPFISILIPTYNRAHYLPQALESALGQDYPHFEVIVADDGSTDGTAEMMAHVNDPRVRYLPGSHAGAPATRNRAIRVARGEFVLWLDSDDILLPDLLKDYAVKLEQFPDADVIYGSLIAVDDHLRERGTLKHEDWWERSFDLISEMFQHNAIPNPGTLVRRSAFDQVGLIDESFRRAHDYEWYVRLAPVGRFKRLERPVALWRWHDSNLSSGSVDIDTSFEARIAKGMLERQTLPELFPTLQWETDPEGSEATALLLASQRLLKWNDMDGAIVWARKSLEVRNTPWTLQLISDLELLTAGRISAPTTLRRTASSGDPSVLLVAHGYPPASLAGTELYTRSLAQSLRSQGAAVTVLVPERSPHLPDGRIAESLDGDVRVVQINLLPPRGLKEMVDDPWAADRLREWLPEQRFDVTHFQHLIGFTGSAMEAASSCGLPVALTLHDAYLFCEQYHLQYQGQAYCSAGASSPMRCAACFHARNQKWSMNRYAETLAYMERRFRRMKEMLLAADVVLSPTQFLIDQLHRHGLAHPDIRLSPLGLSTFDPLPRKETEGGELRLLCLSNVTKVKGVDLLLKAFTQMNGDPVHLELYGRPYEQDLLDEGLKEQPHPERVHYGGEYKPEDLPGLLAGADAVVVPSRFEHYPFVVREALQAGVPVIAPRVGGVPEIVSEGVNGILFEPGNADDLASAIRKLAAAPEMLASLRDGIEPVKSIDEDATGLLEVYQELRTGARTKVELGLAARS
ncbi:MAG: glycosyltransferase [Calditrichaeota bacterium]|nr:glycosyltransferase [Calditrichota bacterium]